MPNCIAKCIYHSIYHRQQNKCYPQKFKVVRKTALNSEMKFDRSNKFDFCYYGQVNSLRLKSSGEITPLGGNIYFAGDE